MKLSIFLAAFGGCDPSLLDDPGAIEGLLRRMVEAGRFTLFALEVVRFEPMGVTGTAVVGESHLSIHTWPEEGRLFLDVASCTTRAAGVRAVEALRAVLPHQSVALSEIAYAPEAGFVQGSLHG